MVIQACPIDFFDALEGYASDRDRARHGICQVYWFFTSKPQVWDMAEFHDRATKYGHHPYLGESLKTAVEHFGPDYVTAFLARQGYDSWEAYQRAIAPCGLAGNSRRVSAATPSLQGSR